VTFQCEECGKTLATEGGFEIHLQSHGPAPAPLTLASIPEPTEPLTPIELPAATPSPQQPRPARPPRPPRPPLAVPGAPAMLVIGLAVASAVMFLVGMTAAVNPSLIRNTKKVTAAAGTTDGNKGTSHSVPIPKTSDPATTPPTAATKPTTPPTTPAASDNELVHTLVLQLADYGPGWTVDASGGNASSGSAGGDATDKELEACVGGVATADPTADTDGPDVINGRLSASTSGTTFASAPDAVADFSLINNPNMIPCFKSAITKQMAAEGVPANAVSLSVQRFSIPAGVTSGGIRSIVTARGPGGTASFYLDMILLQHGRGESFATFSSQGVPVPATVEQALVHRLATKLVALEQVSA